MKKFTLMLLALVAAVAVGCENNTPESVEAPVITLEKGEATSTTLSFKVSLAHATEAAYMVVADGEQMPTLDTILGEGTALDCSAATLTVTAEGLEPNTQYSVVAAAKNSAKSVGSNTLYMTTLEQGELVVSAEIVQCDHEKMNFRIHAENAERVAYLVIYASKEAPDVDYVLLNGEEVDPASRESIEVTGLECAKEYQLLVAAEGNSKRVLAEVVKFTTDDDPANVIKHTYTRASGSKYGSNYFIMLSYEDASEADNFAYNEKTLRLDFYGDPEKDYLPAGTYEVKESTEQPCLSSYYSSYGYVNGVKFSKGAAEVSIDPETKAYTIDVDIFLLDGRHLQATYTGELDNMPVIDIITVATTFNAAQATTTDNGVSYNLRMSDSEGNEASINLVNAHQARYIVATSYTIDTSAEELSVKQLATDAGEFEAATSTFKVAGAEGGEYKFATGTLTVDIDWENSRYLISLYATLESNHVIEAEFVGAIEGVSLELSDEIIDVVLDKASARSYENNTNWYITFSQNVDGVEKYRLVLDAYCAAADYLPAGVYKLGVGSGEGYLDSDASMLYVNGEGDYTFTEATATVTINAEKSEYLFDISARIEDGRTYKLAYTGKVEDMEIVVPEELPDAIAWSTVSAKNWYSDNWELTLKDADEKYVVVLDLYVGDSTLTYIPSGTYEIGDSGKYIKANYSKYNGSSNAFKEVTLAVEYDEAAKLYDLDLSLVLNSGAELSGTYSGAIEGSPEQ